MTTNKFCPECGNPVTPDEKICPKCKNPLEYKPVEHAPYPNEKDLPNRYLPSSIVREKKSGNKKWGHFSWIFLLIGSCIGLFALATPAGSINISGIYSWDMWMFGFNKIFDWEVGWETFWTANEDLLPISLGSTMFVVIGNVLAIVSAAYLVKRGVHKSYLAIISPAISVGAALVYLAGYEIMFYIYFDESFWSVLKPAFAIYGQFLAALFMVLGFFIARIATKYRTLKEKYMHQEKIYLMFKMFIETGPLSENEKEPLNKQLAIITLRFKGISLLENKIEFFATKKSGNLFLESTEFGKALECFQQAIEVSSNQTIAFSKRDLELASKIIIEQDKKKALFYLNEIRNHTDAFLTELLIMYRYRKYPDIQDWKQKMDSTRASTRYPSFSELKRQRTSSSSKTEPVVPDKEVKPVDEVQVGNEKEDKSQEK
ncbi:MAG: hypothetical protein ACW97V_13600 [Promethearchaeota archaeon]